MLAHAGAEGVFQGFPGVLQRFAHGVDRVEPVRERGGAGRGERAARAVEAAGQALKDKGLEQPHVAVQPVHDLRRVFMRAGDEDVFAAE